MARCKDCNVCGFDVPVKFYEKYLVFLCYRCFKKRKEKEVKKHGSN